MVAFHALAFISLVCNIEKLGMGLSGDEAYSVSLHMYKLAHACGCGQTQKCHTYMYLQILMSVQMTLITAHQTLNVLTWMEATTATV